MHNTPRYTIAHVPFLRLLLPLVVGIAWQHLFPSRLAIVACLLVSMGCGVGVWALRNDRLKRDFHIAFVVAVSSAVMGIGMVIYRNNVPTEQLPDVSSQCVAIARIEETPVKKEYSYRAIATIVALNDSTTTRSAHIPVLLNIKHSYTADGLRGGDLIMFSPQLQRIAPPQVPYDFDFAQYMRARGILYRQYLGDDDWQLSSYTTTPTLLQRAKIVQSRCVENLYHSGVSPQNAALLSALLWGYKADIPATTRQYFSAAGLSHVLAVSGLHTGIIALIVACLLYPLRYIGLRKLPYALTIAILWIYAFITGLSPSVIRACIMATFVGVAVLIDRRNTALNALCGSAVGVLLFAPMQLFDIGFQLSYAAVAGILLFTPYLDIACIFDINNRIVHKLSQGIAVSAAAQIATTPIAAYYFHYIPMWGLLSNLIFVPLLPILVVSTLILQLCSACHLPHTALSQVVEAFAGNLSKGANYIANLPGATIDEIWLSPLFLVLYFAIIICLWYILSHRTLRPCIPLAILLIIIQLSLIYQTAKPSTPQAFIAYVRNHTHLQLADDAHRCYIASTDTTATLPRQGEEWRIRQQLHTTIVARNDTIHTPHIYIAIPFIQYYDRMLLWVDDNTWRYTSTSRSIHVDYAIITEQYRGRIKPLVATFDIDTIILSAAIFPPRARQLQQECATVGIGCHNIGEKDIWGYMPRSAE